MCYRVRSISLNGETSLALVSGLENSENYQETLTNYLVPVAAVLEEGKWLFQHNNAWINNKNLI